MSSGRRPRPWIGAIGALLTLIAGTAHAHVGLQSPGGGEEMEIGSTFEIRWTIVIAHDPENWDLWYSTTSSSGPWIAIATDLPPGNPDQGSIHTFDWTVPDDPAEQAWIQVRMDNTGNDYDDVNGAPFSIAGACPGDIDADGEVGFPDLLLTLQSWGPCAECPADVDDDGEVGIQDLVILLDAWGSCAAP